MFILIIVLTLTSILVVYFLYIWKKLEPYNQSSLKIKTFDKNDSPYHPSVLYFKNGWNGYKYWMAETPYMPYTKPYRDRYECPSIHVSQDGVNWTNLKEGNNPIDDLDKKGIKELDYFSDPHLVFKDNKIECWYRLTLRGGKEGNHKSHVVIRKITNDGINWSKREIVIKPENEHPLGEMIISQAVLYFDDKYHIWYVNSDCKHDRKLCYSNSTDGINWTKYTECILKRENANPWHIDINIIDNEIWLTCYDKKDLHLYQGISYTEFEHIKVLLKPSVFGSFYHYGLYRSVLIKDNQYKLYFSADDSFKTYIGVMAGKSPMELKIISPNNKKHCSAWNVIRLFGMWQKRRFNFYKKTFYNKMRIK